MTTTPSSRTQIAQRLRRELVREIDHAILVERLLTDAHYARDVLLVCDALPGTVLAALAAQFREATAAMPTLLAEADWNDAAPTHGLPAGPLAAPGHTRQPNEWAGDTSGFGVTQPPLMSLPQAPASGASLVERRRLKLGRWRRE